MVEQYWTTANGRTIAVGKMDITHLRNTLRMLIRENRISDIPITSPQATRAPVPEVPQETQRCLVDMDANPYLQGKMRERLTKQDFSAIEARAAELKKRTRTHSVDKPKVSDSFTTFAEEMGHDEPNWFDDDLI